MVFDKTGTVTEGRFEIVKIIAVDRDEDELLALAAAAERGSDHPLARVIVEEAARRKLAVPEPDDAQVLPGRGVECTIGAPHHPRRQCRVPGRAWRRHTEHLLDEADRLGATAVLVADGDRLAGAHPAARSDPRRRPRSRRRACRPWRSPIR